MLTKTKCWFESNTKIVPQLKQQYILKKDFAYEYGDKSQFRFDKGMVCELYSYNSEEGLELKIDLRTMPKHKDIDESHRCIFFHPISAKLEGGIGGKVFKQYKVSQFYDYFEELDKDMTMADVLDVRQAMDNLHSGVRALRTAIDEMDGDCNSLIVDDYPFPHSYDEWVIGFYDWYNSVNENIDIYRHAIKSLGGKDAQR
jgi:DNA-binding cell septation regulator SpoVG